MNKPGDMIDLYDPPEHCGEPMTVYTTRGNTSAYDVVCEEDEYALHTDHDGIVLH